MDYKGFYINLDRRPDRCAATEAEFARTHLGHKYERFAALDGNAIGMTGADLSNSQKGCFASHMLLLKENLGSTAHLHIVEDDVQFGPCTEQGLRLAIERGWLNDYDILFTDTYILPVRESFQAYKALYDQAIKRDAAGQITDISFGVANLQHKLFASSNSYLVNQTSIQKIYDLFAAEATHGARLPIDLLMRQLCIDGVLRIGLIFPFLTATRLKDSLVTDIGSPGNEPSHLAGEIARMSFFIGCNWRECEGYLQQYLPLPTPYADEHKRILAHILAAFAGEGL